MNRTRNNVVMTLGALLVSVTACATTPAHQDWWEARSSDPRTAHLAYAAQRKAELAEASATFGGAGSAEGRSSNDAKEASAAQIAEAPSQRADAAARRARRARQLEAERTASAATEKRAKDAMALLAAGTATVSRESRGTVITLSGSALFASNEDGLLPGAQDELGLVAEILMAEGDREIVVEEHTDSHGSAASNRSLSDRRARAVVGFLISRGVPSDQLKAEGLGPTRPIAQNGSPEGRASNRRVEIIVTPAESH